MNMERFTKQNTLGIRRKDLTAMNELFAEEFEKTFPDADSYYINPDYSQRVIEQIEAKILSLVDAI